MITSFITEKKLVKSVRRFDMLRNYLLTHFNYIKCPKIYAGKVNSNGSVGQGTGENCHVTPIKISVERVLLTISFTAFFAKPAPVILVQSIFLQQFGRPEFNF